MTSEEIEKLVQAQREYFSTGATQPIEFRIQAMRRLHEAVSKQEALICDALKKDLGKSRFESYECEVGMVLSELSYMIRHVRSFAAEKTRHTPLAQFASHSYVRPEPYGTALIMSPWNYPFMLTLDPLADAIAAGNTAVVKPSAYSPETSEVIAKILRECFPPEYVAVVTGGREENSALLQESFDCIFFTGSQSVGRIVMHAAAEHLTPVTLELGGKSPCVVDKSANIALAARRIAFGKFLNCGQTCVAPDYVYCHRDVKEQFIKALCTEIRRQYGESPLENGDYGRIVNRRHFERLLGLIDSEKIVHGGRSDEQALRIEPTVLDNVTWNDAVMGEEIFGPVLPVMTYGDENEVVKAVESHDHPLAMYVFGSVPFAKSLMARCRFGGGCINDTIIHLATSEMGFGGVGASGMGSYHGKEGFDAFSHKKSIVDKKTWLDLPVRYQPYTSAAEKMLRFFLK